MAGWAAAMLLGATAAGQAQLLYPAANADVRLGDLRGQFARAFQEAPRITQPGWRFIPAIDLGLGWANPANPAAGGRRRADFFASVSPSLLIQGEGQRVTATVSIAPQIRRYFSTPEQNSTSLNFNGQSTVTLVPDALSVDLSGAAFTRSQVGGYSDAGAAGLGRQDQIQTMTFSVDPKFRHRFGTFGVAEVDYALSHTSTTGANSAVVSPFLPPVTNQSILTRTLRGRFSSGEDFGRFNFGSEVIRTDNTGSGTLSGAHRYTETVTLGYAVSRTVIVSGSIGHENIRYRGGTSYRVDGLTWNAKVTWTPNPDSTITVGYGRHDGNNSLSVDATYAPSAQVRLGAQYSEALTTSDEAAQQLLAGSVLNAAGIPVDPRTGLPVAAGSNFFGAQTSVARVRRASLSASLLRQRDVFSLILARDQTSYLASTTGSTTTPGLSTNGITVSGAWQHSFTEAWNGTFSLGYGNRHSEGPTASSQQTVNAGLGFTYAFSQTLSGNAQYSYNGTLSRSGAGLPNFDQTLITLGLHKSF